MGAVARVDRGLGERDRALGQADEVDGLLGGDGDGQRRGVRHADVLGREDHDAPGDEEGILARFEHPGQPVDRRVRVRCPDRLDERGDRVVVAVARLVVERSAPLQRLLDERTVDPLPAPDGGKRDLGGEFEAVQCDARIAGGRVQEEAERVGIERDALVAQPALGIGEGRDG